MHPAIKSINKEIIHLLALTHPKNRKSIRDEAVKKINDLKMQRDFVKNQIKQSKHDKV